MNVSDILERLMVAAFGGAVAALVVLFLGGCVWFLAIVVPGDAMSISLTKWLLVYIPITAGIFFTVFATFAPDTTADYFGSLTQRFWRAFKNSTDEWP